DVELARREGRGEHSGGRRGRRRDLHLDAALLGQCGAGQGIQRAGRRGDGLRLCPCGCPEGHPGQQHLPGSGSGHAAPQRVRPPSRPPTTLPNTPPVVVLVVLVVVEPEVLVVVPPVRPPTTPPTTPTTGARTPPVLPL